MRCIHCGRDCKYKERTDGRCPGCRKKFAFEPQNKDPFTDAAFKSAIDRVSANGQVRWGVEHLYYELCRRLSKRSYSWGYFVLFFIVASVVSLVAGMPLGIPLLLPVGIVGWALLRRYGRPATVAMAQSDFDRLWKRWLEAHGEPPGLIARKTDPGPPRAREADIGDYSFDRAVICDRARTVDLLIANNFHFEHNCAVLSIDGYPQGPFDVVLSMLKRNPKLQVFALHDATVEGCKLAHKLAHSPQWFEGHVPVTDVGIRPRHSAPFKGLFQAALSQSVADAEGILEDEAAWLNQYSLELAAIRPEQILKRLYKAINKRESQHLAGDGGGSSGNGYVYTDNDSFSSNATDSDGGADSFG
jgi:hypothetical protein